jgi:lupus La protein
MAETEQAIVEENNEKPTAEDIERDNAEVISKLPKLDQIIIKQMEYYFSESNLRRDKFMIQKIGENEEGWVELSVMLTFNRLKAITTEASAIVEALDKSPNGIVQVSDDKTKVRRHPDNPLPEFNEARRKELQDRTAYAKGFPLDSVMADIIDYFNENFENVEQVQMRKYFDREGKEGAKKYLFKGSVFITFTKPEYAEEFVSKPDLKYKEKDLLRYMQKKYLEVKKQETIDRKKKSQKRKEGTDENTPEFNLPKAAILAFKGIKGEISREDIKSAVNKIDNSFDIAFINFKRGDEEGSLRFTKENDGQKFLEKLGDEKVRNTQNSFKN